MRYLSLCLIVTASITIAGELAAQEETGQVQRIGSYLAPHDGDVIQLVSACSGCTDPACESPSCGVHDPDSCTAAGSDACCDCGLGLCNLGDAWTLNGLLFGDCEPAISFGGWAQSGYYTDSNDLFNNRPDKYAVEQAWLYAERVASSDNPLGFRVDIMYGLDADDTQAFGNNPGQWDFQNGFDHGAFGWALPQVYGELALGDWSVKAGHFYTLIGYEVVTAPDNFFFSHAMTMYNSEPFTHTGVVASRPLGEHVEVYAGWTLGWDTGFDQVDGGSSWLGGVSLTLTDKMTFTYMSTAGNFGFRGDEAYSHSLVFDMSVTEKLNWVVQSDLLRVDSNGEDNVGVNQYLLYMVNDCLALGTRVEWWKADAVTDYAPHRAVLPTTGSFSYYEATFGANIRPFANIVVRPEVRIDWSPALGYDESYFAIDSIFTF